MSGRAIVYVLDNDRNVLRQWEEEAKARPEEVVVKTFGAKAAMEEATECGRPDLVVIDLRLDEGPVEGLRLAVELTAGNHASFAVICSGFDEAGVRGITDSNPRVAYIIKDALGDDLIGGLVEQLKAEPLMYLAYRALLSAREETASLIASAAQSPLANTLKSALAACRGEGDEGRLVGLFTRNAFREHVRTGRSTNAQALDVYQLASTIGPAVSYGNILVGPESAGTEGPQRRIVLSPACDLVPERKGNPPSGPLTFGCWTAAEFVAMLRAELDRGASRSAAGSDGVRDYEHLGQKVLRPKASAESIAKEIRKSLCDDREEWCYVLPSPKADGDVRIVDFRYPHRVEYDELCTWRVEATVEREWALHMLHKFSRWVGRLGVHDVDQTSTAEAIAKAIIEARAEDGA